MAIKKRLKLEKGDIFEVPFENCKKGYFQYVMDDESLMGSNIISVFDIQISNESVIDFEILKTCKFKFYTHCMVLGGYKLDIFFKIGNLQLEDNFKIPYFRDQSERGGVEKSYSWYVWKANEEFEKIGELTEKYKSYNLGGIFHPLDVKEWMETGECGFFFPK